MKRPSVDAGPAVIIEKKYVVPPAVMAHRMQRYSVALIILAFLIVALTYTSPAPPILLWFAAGLSAVFALMCAVTVTVLHAIAWNFDRLREELRGGRDVTDMR
jgi:membrane protease YdiL (CAAX protease family)